MNGLQKAIELAMEKYNDEIGKGAPFEDGDTFVAIFDDGCIVVALENRNLKIHVEPNVVRINQSLNLYKEPADDSDDEDDLCY